MKQTSTLLLIFAVVCAVLVLDAYATQPEYDVLTPDELIEGTFTEGEIVHVYGQITYVGIEDGADVVELDEELRFVYASPLPPEYPVKPDLEGLLNHNVVLVVAYHAPPALSTIYEVEVIY